MAIAAATSGFVRPLSAKKAMTASWFEEHLRWAMCLEAMRASAGARHQLVTRKSSATKRVGGAVAVERR